MSVKIYKNGAWQEVASENPAGLQESDMMFTHVYKFDSSNTDSSIFNNTYGMYDTDVIDYTQSGYNHFYLALSKYWMYIYCQFKSKKSVAVGYSISAGAINYDIVNLVCKSAPLNPKLYMAEGRVHNDSTSPYTHYPIVASFSGGEIMFPKISRSLDKNDVVEGKVLVYTGANTNW